MFMYVRINEMKNAIDTDMKNAVKTVAYFLSIFIMRPQNQLKHNRLNLVNQRSNFLHLTHYFIYNVGESD